MENSVAIGGSMSKRSASFEPKGEREGASEHLAAPWGESFPFNTTICTAFVFIVAIGVFVFGVMLIWAAAGSGPVLAGPDAIFPFSRRTLFGGISGSSVLLSALLLLAGPRRNALKLYLVAWFSCVLCLDQIGTLWIGGTDFRFFRKV